MKLKITLLILLLLPGLAWSQEAGTRRKVRKTKQHRIVKKKKPITVDSISGPVEITDTKKQPPPLPEGKPAPAPVAQKMFKPVKESRTSTHEFGLGMESWQETMKLKQAGSESLMEAQSKAFTISYDIHSNSYQAGPYWLYGLEIGAGTIKGKGEAPIQDQFDNQTFTMITARVGRMFRTSEVSQWGLVLPLAFRTVNWVYEPNSTTKAEEKKFSAGAGILFESRLTERGRLRASVTRQHVWDANMWAAAWAVQF